MCAGHSDEKLVGMMLQRKGEKIANQKGEHLPTWMTPFQSCYVGSSIIVQFGHMNVKFCAMATNVRHVQCIVLHFVEYTIHSRSNYPLPQLNAPQLLAVQTSATSKPQIRSETQKYEDLYKHERGI